MNRPQQPVVILYRHSLLGEGIATIVRAETGVAVQVVAVADRDAVERALARQPVVVIFELGPSDTVRNLARRAPHAALIDVTATMSTGPALPAAGTSLERILTAVRCGTGRGEQDRR